MRPLQQPSSKRHDIYVVVGAQAVQALLDGVTSVISLKSKGRVQKFTFPTLEEANAFSYGIEIASFPDDAIAVEELDP